MAKYDPDKYHRRSIRLPSWDYQSTGAYFVTLVTAERAFLFGDIADQSVCLSCLGEIVRGEWLASEAMRRELTLDEWIVMPNHLHGIVYIERTTGVPTKTASPSPRTPAPIQRPPQSLGSFIAGFKSACNRRINDLRETPGAPVWQRNYYESVIRNERHLNALRRYIRDNPVNWAKDKENPENAR